MSTGNHRKTMKRIHTYPESIKKSLIGVLTIFSLSSTTALAAQPTDKQREDTHPSCGCLNAVLAAGYTLENNKKDKDDKYHKKDRDDKKDKDDKDDKYDKKDKDDKGDRKDKDDKGDRKDNDDKDRNEGRSPSTSKAESRPRLTGLLIYEVYKNGLDFDVYVDPQNCQIRSVIQDR
jgi:ABC-type antimicrobial peptide transport system permease subunit